MNGRAVVVGGGIAGLTAAWRLQRGGYRVTVLEAADHVGGRMASVRKDGYLLDVGASVLSGRYREMIALAAEVGVGDQLRPTHDVIGFLRDGEVHRVRMHALRDMLATKLISWPAKASAARMLWDARRVAGKVDTGNMSKAAGLDTETVQRYADRRLSTELRDYLVDPTMRALIQGPLDSVASTELFFLLRNFLGAGLMNAEGGVDFLARALAERLDVRLGARATSVEETGDGVVVSYARAGESERVERAEVCVIALTAADMARIHPRLDPERRDIVAGLRYSTLWSVALGVDPCPAEKSVFVQIPTREHPDLACAVFEHNKCPGRAPAGKGLLNSYWLTDWYDKREHLDDEAVAYETAKGLDLVIPGVADHIEFVHVSRWKPGLLVGAPGTWAALARFHALTPAAGRVQLAGDYVGGSTTNSALCSGERAARILLAHHAEPSAGSR